MPQVLVNGVPLDQKMLEDSFEEAVVTEVMKQTHLLQQAVYKVRTWMFMLIVVYLWVCYNRGSGKVNFVTFGK